jgi:hypothetical protein
MPRYRAKTMLFVAGARIRAGQEFSSNEPPNDQWEPLDRPAAEQPKPAKAEATPPPPPEAPIDPFADKDATWLRNFILTKTKREPKPEATIEQLRARARSIVAAEGNDT